jgi:hypothetical protein
LLAIEEGLDHPAITVIPRIGRSRTSAIRDRIQWNFHRIPIRASKKNILVPRGHKVKKTGASIRGLRFRNQTLVGYRSQKTKRCDFVGRIEGFGKAGLRAF